MTLVYPEPTYFWLLTADYMTSAWFIVGGHNKKETLLAYFLICSSLNVAFRSIHMAQYALYNFCLFFFVESVEGMT